MDDMATKLEMMFAPSPYAYHAECSSSLAVCPEYRLGFRRSSNAATTKNYVVDTADEFAPFFAKLDEIDVNDRLWPENADRPTNEALAGAKVVLQKFREFDLLPSSVVASAEGGVAICFINNDKYSDIECLNSGEILGVNSNRRDIPIAWEIGLSDHAIEVSVSQIRDFLHG
jgi:hypothetical protein